MKSLGTETLKAFALDLSALDENHLFLDRLKKATAILAMKEDTPNRKTTSNAQRLLNTLRANQLMMYQIQQSIEGNDA